MPTTGAFLQVPDALWQRLPQVDHPDGRPLAMAVDTIPGDRTSVTWATATSLGPTIAIATGTCPGDRLPDVVAAAAPGVLLVGLGLRAIVEGLAAVAPVAPALYGSKQTRELMPLVLSSTGALAKVTGSPNSHVAIWAAAAALEEPHVW